MTENLDAALRVFFGGTGLWCLLIAQDAVMGDLWGTAYGLCILAALGIYRALR